MVQHATAQPLRDGRAAFAALCLAYWYPVYAHVRRSGHPPAIALDLARAFLGHLLALSGGESGAVPARQFRAFLLARLSAFLAADWRDTKEEALPEPALPDIDIESRYLRDCAHTTSPEDAFHRAFALEILARAAQRLASEAQQTGHLDMYHTLAPFLARDPAPAACEAIAQQLHTRALVVVVALRRLRQRFRELVGEELADTVTTVDEFVAERHALFALLSESFAPGMP